MSQSQMPGRGHSICCRMIQSSFSASSSLEVTVAASIGVAAGGMVGRVGCPERGGVCRIPVVSGSVGGGAAAVMRWERKGRNCISALAISASMVIWTLCGAAPPASAWRVGPRIGYVIVGSKGRGRCAEGPLRMELMCSTVAMGTVGTDGSCGPAICPVWKWTVVGVVGP